MDQRLLIDKIGMLDRINQIGLIVGKKIRRIRKRTKYGH